MTSVFQTLLPFVSAHAWACLKLNPFRSLEDDYSTINGLLSFVRTSVETISHRIHLPAIYTGWKILQNLSLHSSIFSLTPDLVCYRILEEIQFWNYVLMGYFSPKCGHEVELCSLPRNSMKPCSSFESKTYLFADSAIEWLWKWLKLEINLSSARMGRCWSRLECLIQTAITFELLKSYAEVFAYFAAKGLLFSVV